LLLNKIDLVTEHAPLTELIHHYEQSKQFAKILTISCYSGINILESAAELNSLMIQNL
jgi:GTPase Era involved in 16S rRNA processing